jgi:hypothetical protein
LSKAIFVVDYTRKYANHTNLFMKKDLAGITKRLIAGMLVVVAIVGVSALTIHSPSQNSAARSLNSIQTDKATLFYADAVPGCYFVEQVLPNTRESKAATENLKLVAATL